MDRIAQPDHPAYGFESRPTTRWLSCALTSGRVAGLTGRTIGLVCSSAFSDIGAKLTSAIDTGLDAVADILVVAVGIVVADALRDHLRETS